MMTALNAIKERLFGTEPDESPGCDPRRDALCRLLKTAQVSEAESWRVVNESRARRGEPPIDPARQSLITEALVRARDWEAS